MSRRKNRSKAAAHDRPAERPEPEPQSLEERVKDIHERIRNKVTAEANGMLEILGSRRRLMWVNFIAGLARGVGFFLGVTIIGALVLALLALFFDTAAERLGFKDITLDRAVRSAVAKFSQIQDIVGEAKAELQEAKEANDAGKGAGVGASGAAGTTGPSGATGGQQAPQPSQPPPDTPPKDG